MRNTADLSAGTGQCRRIKDNDHHRLSELLAEAERPDQPRAIECTLSSMQSCMVVHALGHRSLQGIWVLGGLDGVLPENRKGAITVSNEPTAPGDPETIS